MPDGSNLILGSEGAPAWKANNKSDATTRIDRNGTKPVTALVVENLNGPALLAVAHAGAGVAATSGVEAISSNGSGVLGRSIDAAGVAGLSTSGAGVKGTSRNAPGVQGISNGAAGVSGSAAALGVHGLSDRIGVKGEGSIGVHGEAGSVGVLGEARNGTGVWGSGRVGVLGASSAGDGVSGNSDTGTGVKGESNVIAVAGTSFGAGTSHAGVLGVSRTDRVGVWGRSDKAVVHGFTWTGAGAAKTGVAVVTGAGVLAESPAGTGIVARTGAPGTGLAGAFFGSVAIDGDAIVTGNAIVFGGKAAAVRHPDGSHRLTFAVEAPESFFEDFGRGRVVRGRARVTIDRDFAMLVDRQDYHVFLTPEGESHGLYVSKRGRDSFEVREQQDGTHTVAFSYRLVARRKDVPRRRLPTAPVRDFRLEGFPPVAATAGTAGDRKAPSPPNPLAAMDRPARAKARAITRQGRRGKAAKKSRAPR